MTLAPSPTGIIALMEGALVLSCRVLPCALLRRFERVASSLPFSRAHAALAMGATTCCMAFSAALIRDGPLSAACVAVGACCGALLALVAPSMGGLFCSLLLAVSHAVARGPRGLAVRLAVAALGAAGAFLLQEHRKQECVQARLFRGSEHDAHFQVVEQALASAAPAARQRDKANLGPVMVRCALDEFTPGPDIRWRDALFDQRDVDGWFQPRGARSARDCLCACALEVFAPHKACGPLNALKAAERLGEALCRRTRSRVTGRGRAVPGTAALCHWLLRLGGAPTGALDFGTSVGALQCGLLRLFALADRWIALFDSLPTGPRLAVVPRINEATSLETLLPT